LGLGAAAAFGGARADQIPLHAGEAAEYGWHQPRGAGAGIGPRLGQHRLVAYRYMHTRDATTRHTQWPRADILALIGIIIAAVGSVAAVIAKKSSPAENPKVKVAYEKMTRVLSDLA
jgi:hypothetical protein